MTALSHLDWLSGRPVSRRRLRRLSRQFATVGVTLPAARLAEIAAGAPVTEDEVFDIRFAETADRIRGEQRRGTRVRARRRCVHWAVVTGAVVVALNLLLCLGLVFYVLAEHTWPY
jgi:hypothetical protein